MILLPAIDIIDGKAVRLLQGDFAQQTDYDSDPLDAAKRWVDMGARALHVVDLDGARTGVPANVAHIERIARTLGVPVQVGGGLRSLDSVRAIADAGAARVILGTAAFRDPEFLDAAVAGYAEQVVVSIDAREGRVAAAGWTEQTDVSARSALAILREHDVSRFVYSSIDRDGVLAGPDTIELSRACDVVGDCEVVYSGGVATAGDLGRLRGLGLEPLRGVIVGTALFEGRLTVAEGRAALDAR
jgi:phosphoribosylformimino-5-aminoimidazole carboxamide ribotide isomerase